MKKSLVFQQYETIKAKYPDAIVLFKAAESYITFADDAVKISNIFDIDTFDKDGRLVCGFASEKLDNYLPILVRAGHRVAICDQICKVADK